MPGERRETRMAYEVEIKDLPAQAVLTIRRTTTPGRMSEAFDEIYPQVAAYAAERGAKPAGPPFALYHAYGDEEVDLEAGIPVETAVEGSDRIISRELPAGRAAVAWHVGPYDTIGEAHEFLDGWVHGQGMDHVGAPWEVYWTDPSEEPDSSNWRTEVGYPIP
jgi:effector-binding domain-containing protein